MLWSCWGRRWHKCSRGQRGCASLQPPVYGRHTLDHDRAMAKGYVLRKGHVDNGSHFSLHPLWLDVNNPQWLLYSSGQFIKIDKLQIICLMIITIVLWIHNIQSERLFSKTGIQKISVFGLLLSNIQGTVTAFWTILFTSF